jgi:hypothetical protein
MPVAAPDRDTHLTRGELWILGWLEGQGHSPDVLTDVDFHDDGCDPGQYPLLVVGTHPEYWTPRMYDRLASYLDAGGSLAYLGGNGLFETGEYDDDRTAMVFRLGIEGGAREAALFRVQGRTGTLAPRRRPPNAARYRDRPTWCAPPVTRCSRARAWPTATRRRGRPQPAPQRRQGQRQGERLGR